MNWKLAEAKNRLSEVVNRALSEGPQTISRRGDEVILISKNEFLRRTGGRESFTDFLLGGPSLQDVDFTRATEEMRSVKL